MSRIVPFVVVVLASLAGQVLTGQAFAQLTPPAGTAGAGMAPINGIPYGAANPRLPSDLSGIGNAGAVPPLRSNFPASAIPQTNIAPLEHAPAPSPSLYSSEPVLNAHAVEPRHKKSPAPRGHREVSSFTGICRGC
jgi:hypothetical protein